MCNCLTCLHTNLQCTHSYKLADLQCCPARFPNRQMAKNCKNLISRKKTKCCSFVTIFAKTKLYFDRNIDRRRIEITSKCSIFSPMGFLWRHGENFLGIFWTFLLSRKSFGLVTCYWVGGHPY